MNHMANAMIIENFFYISTSFQVFYAPLLKIFLFSCSLYQVKLLFQTQNKRIFEINNFLTFTEDDCQLIN